MHNPLYIYRERELREICLIDVVFRKTMEDFSF